MSDGFYWEQKAQQRQLEWPKRALASDNWQHNLVCVELRAPSVSIRFNSDRCLILRPAFGTCPGECSQGRLSLSLDGRCATNKYFQIIGSIHDIESYFGIDNTASSYVQIFFCHWAHKAIIFVWVSRNLFHIAWNGNYELWEQNPIKTIPIAHGICDPHFGLSNIRNKIAYNGIYNWLYTLGFDSVFKHLYKIVITDELLAVISIPLALIHLIYLDSLLHKTLAIWAYLLSIRDHGRIFIWPFKLFCAYFDLGKQRLNFQVGIIIGLLSIGWCAHLVHLGIPISRAPTRAAPLVLRPVEFYTGNWVLYIGPMDKDNHIFRSTYAAAESSLTFFGGLKSNTISLYLTDIAHHHLGLGILFVLSTHLYLSLYKGFGHTIADLLRVNGNSAIAIPLNKSVHLQLSLGCTGLGRITSLTGQQVYSLRAYVYLCYDYITSLGLYLHHQYIGSFLVMASLAHAGILSIRDYTIIFSQGGWAPGSLPQRLGEALRATCGHLGLAGGRPKATWPALYTSLGLGPGRILKMKGQFISHLSWICVYLGFHTLGVYIHNDSIVAFQVLPNQILIEAAYGRSWAPGSLPKRLGELASAKAVGPQPAILEAAILVAGDLLASHAIALGLHVTHLILFKGSLDARGSKLMPDKINFGVSFACDGPIRGGTCDISAWDSNYLALFWMLNTGAWITFYFHWKHLSVCQNTVFQFDESSTYLNGWFRDYLWFNSTPLMNGYNTFGPNDLSILSWAFLGAHLVWATGFMFLISWRGYWQELIDIILVMHLKTPILYNLWNGHIYTPLALSIVQARFVGLVHFSTGFILTYAAFIIGGTT